MRIAPTPPLLFAFAVLVGGGASAAEPLAPMLRLPEGGEDPAAIDFARLPALGGEHATVTAADEVWKFRLHSYLAHFEGRYWCMWSHGPVIEDNPTQHVRFATSEDGLRWSEPGVIVGPSPRPGFRYIARGFWIRDGRLIALASHDEAFDGRGKVHFFGRSLQLLGFAWAPASKRWEPLGPLHDDAINNFPPRRLPGGSWGMLCRDHERKVAMLVGGVESPTSWHSLPVAPYAAEGGFRPEEPDWWTLPDGRLLGLFRDNGRSHRLFRALSEDGGRTWSPPSMTNFPDATSKFFSLRTSRGDYMLVSNPNPSARNPLCLSTSDDGVTFTRMARLPIPEGPRPIGPPPSKPESLQYPHAIEHDGHLLIAFSRRKQTIEVVKVPLAEVDRLRRGR